MLKTIALTGAALSVAVAAWAEAPKKPADTKAPTKLHCAVMTTNEVNIKEATAKKMFADYKGNRYFFCCGGCPDAFKKDPAKYAKAEHIPTPASAPKAKKTSGHGGG